MKVSVIVRSGTIQDDRRYKIGDLYECDDTEAARLVRLGVAEMAAPADNSNDQGGVEPPAASPASLFDPHKPTEVVVPPEPAPAVPVVKSTSFRNPLRRNR